MIDPLSTAWSYYHEARDLAYHCRVYKAMSAYERAGHMFDRLNEHMNAAICYFLANKWHYCIKSLEKVEFAQLTAEQSTMANQLYDECSVRQKGNYLNKQMKLLKDSIKNEDHTRVIEILSQIPSLLYDDQFARQLYESCNGLGYTEVAQLIKKDLDSMEV